VALFELCERRGMAGCDEAAYAAFMETFHPLLGEAETET
jgi:hypothetical protein